VNKGVKVIKRFTEIEVDVVYSHLDLDFHFTSCGIQYILNEESEVKSRSEVEK